MGINIFNKSSNSYWAGRIAQDRVNQEGNPNPHNFEVKQCIWKGNVYVVEVNYPDCKNYEGNKILVISKDDFNKAMDCGILDPHFSNKGQTVIARFEPTPKGWNMAMEFVEKCKI